MDNSEFSAKIGNLQSEKKDINDKIKLWETIKGLAQNVEESLSYVGVKYDEIGQLFSEAYTIGGRPLDIASNTIEYAALSKNKSIEAQQIITLINIEIDKLTSELQLIESQISNVKNEYYNSQNKR